MFGLFAKAKFEPKRIERAIEKMKGDLSKIQEKNKELFKTILESEGEIMRLRANINQMQAEQTQLNKEEAKTQAHIEIISELLENTEV